MPADGRAAPGHGRLHEKLNEPERALSRYFLAVLDRRRLASTGCSRSPTSTGDATAASRACWPRSRSWRGPRSCPASRAAPTPGDPSLGRVVLAEIFTGASAGPARRRTWRSTHWTSTSATTSSCRAVAPARPRARALISARHWRGRSARRTRHADGVLQRHQSRARGGIPTRPPSSSAATPGDRALLRLRPRCASPRARVERRSAWRSRPSCRASRRPAPARRGGRGDAGVPGSNKDPLPPLRGARARSPPGVVRSCRRGRPATRARPPWRRSPPSWIARWPRWRPAAASRSGPRGRTRTGWRWCSSLRTRRGGEVLQAQRVSPGPARRNGR